MEFVKLDTLKPRFDLITEQFVETFLPRGDVSWMLQSLIKLGNAYHEQDKEACQNIFDLIVTDIGVIDQYDLGQVAVILSFGANKYKANNWKLCEDAGRYISAAARHYEDYLTDNESLDPETGVKHYYHFLTNIMFIQHLI